MDVYHLIGIVIFITGLILYFNHRYLHWQHSIAVMSGTLALSLILLLAAKYGWPDADHTIGIELSKIDFHHFLLDGILSYLSFAGALELPLQTFYSKRYEITVLAMLSTVLSTIILGGFTYGLLPVSSYPMPLTYCLLFGALISPTDPIAVLAIFKQLGVDQELRVTVTGESLFNDGIGIVIFLTLYQLTFTDHPITPYFVSSLFFTQAIGGMSFGLVLGFMGDYFIRRTDDKSVMILLTLALVTAGYALANYLHLSGPLAMVVAGIIIGRSPHLSDLRSFWEMIDEVLNALLFSLLGLECLVIDFSIETLAICVAAIGFALIARWISVYFSLASFRLLKPEKPYFTSILVWGGLRGALAVALALSLPSSPFRDLILSMTCAIVAFSILVQGGSMGALVKRSQVTASS